MQHTRYGSLLLLALLGCSSSFENVNPFTFLTRDTEITSDDIGFFDPSGNPIDPKNPNIPTDGSVSATESKQQPSAGTVRPFDLIFVSDTSGSLTDERQATEPALKNFLSKMDEDGFTDYCVAVMPAHISEPYAGALYAAGGNSKCLCSNDFASAAELAAKFAENFKDTVNDSVADGGEAPFYSFNKSLTDSAKLQAIKDAGCFRDTAVLISAMFTDENEISTSPNQNSGTGGCSQTWTFPSAGPATVVDTECKEQPARMNYYSDASGNLVLDYNKMYQVAREYTGALPYFSLSVAYTNMATVPSGGENEYGYGVNELAELSGGFKVDLSHSSNQAQFNQDWSDLAGLVKEKVSLLTQFTMNKIPCAAPDVTVDGNAITSCSWTEGSKTVTCPINDVGSYGSMLIFSYKVCGL